jgi:hypothetical protein
LGRNHTAGFFWPYFYTSNCSFTLGSPPGNGDGDTQNVMLPASPDRDENRPINIPAGIKSAAFSSSNGGNPRRGSGIRGPLPSLVVDTWHNVAALPTWLAAIVVVGYPSLP